MGSGCNAVQLTYYDLKYYLAIEHEFCCVYFKFQNLQYLSSVVAALDPSKLLVNLSKSNYK